MRLVNHTPHTAETFQARHPSDSKTLRVVVVKGSFSLPTDGGDCQLAAVAAALNQADSFVGAPGLTAPLFEADFSTLKSKCDVVVVGHAYAAGGRPVDRLVASIRVGDWQKSVAVFGARHWQRGMLRYSASPTLPFERVSVGYEGAFGGTVFDHPSGRVICTFSPNPVGCGYYEDIRLADRQALPWLQAENVAVHDPRGRYAPVALGVLPRTSDVRAEFAGTYDDSWRTDRFPDLPVDFDVRYFQATASDQWIDPPRGGEEVVLSNLSPDAINLKGTLRFKLPPLDLPITAHLRRGSRINLTCSVDTLTFEPDQRRFSVVWRTHMRMQRDETELSAIEIGTRPAATSRGHVVSIPLRHIGRPGSMSSGGASNGLSPPPGSQA